MRCPNCQSLKITVFHCAGRYGRCDLIQHEPADHYVCETCGYEKLSSVWLGRHGDPARGPLFWLCVPIVLAYLVGKVALAWLKTKLPSRKAYYRCCRDCGWRLSWDAASLICPPCQEARRQRASASEPAWIAEAWELEEQIAKASVSKLFCCDVDLTYLGFRPGGSAIDYRYRCPTCGRIWLYIVEWHKDSGNTADWYPQAMEVDGGKMPPLFDERTRTKVYL